MAVWPRGHGLAPVLHDLPEFHEFCGLASPQRARLSWLAAILTILGISTLLWASIILLACAAAGIP